MRAGAVISPYYDSLIAKVICHGENRERARARLAAALGEFSLLGVQNTAAFLRDIVMSGPFAEADLSTRFLPEFFPNWTPPEANLRAALAAAAMVAQGALETTNGGRSDHAIAAADGAAISQSPLVTARRIRAMEPAMKLREAGGGRQFDVELLGRDGDSVRLLIDGEEITMATEPNAGDGTILRCGETVVASMPSDGATRFSSPPGRRHSSSSRSKDVGGVAGMDSRLRK